MFYIWLAVIIVGVLAEFATLNFVTLCFAAGAALALVATLFLFPWWAQLIIFVLFSGSMLVLLRPALRRAILPRSEDREIGKKY